MMSFFLVTLFISGLAVAIHYEALAWISLRLPEIGVSQRLRILIGLVGCLLAHIVEVWIFAFAYHVLIKFEKFGNIEVFGDIHGNFNPTLLDCVYFSLVPDFDGVMPGWPENSL